MRLMYCAVALMSLFATNVYADSLLVNGDFEQPLDWNAGVQRDAGFSAFTGNQISGWTIEAGHAVTVHNTVMYPTISGGFSVNMDGEGINGRNANFYQNFASTSGYTYALGFDWSVWFPATGPKLDVSVIDTTSNSVLYNGSFADTSSLQHESALFNGTGNILRLRVMESPESGSNDNKFIVDNFSVTVAAVPEPETYAMLLAGLGLISTVGKRLKAKHA